MHVLYTKRISTILALILWAAVILEGISYLERLLF